MKKLNFDYNLYNKNGKWLQKGHINYSISHFIYVQYQKTYLQYTGKTIPTPQHFWNNFKDAINEKNKGNMFFAFTQNQPQMLNKTSKSGAMQIMHAFGYFAFHDITGTYPFFTRRGNHGRVFLEEPSSQSGMSFHFGIPQKQPTQSYSKLFMATFEQNGNYSLVNEQGTFLLRIVDPIGDKRTDDIAAKSYLDNKNKVLEDLNGIKEFSVKTKNVNLTIYISKEPIAEFDGKLDSYTDGEIYIYVRENLKVSEYIHFIDDERLVLSLRTSSLIKLDEEKYVALKDGDFSLFNEEEVVQLKRMMFIVSYLDEYKQLQKNRRIAYKKQDANSMGFTILTTTQCNARCPYCYEKGMRQFPMSIQTQEKVAELICEHPEKKVHISWFGGEPLLNADAINYITSRMRECGIKFSSSMISNGYLIDKNLEYIHSWHLKSIQITLDGIFEKYDSVKNYVYPGHAFEKIIANIGALIKNNVKVSIRLNFNSDNYLDILECIDYLYQKFGSHNLLSIYPHHIFGDNYYLSDGTNIHTTIYKKMIDCGYVRSLGDLGLKTKTFSCFVNNKNHRVIGADGRLYLCEHIGDEKCIGHIDDGITNLGIYEYWSNLSYPYNKCNQCKYVFLCQGGCKNERNNGESSCCIPFLDSLDEIIKYYYKNKKQKGGC